MALWQKLLIEFLIIGILVFLAAYFLIDISVQDSFIFTAIILAINGVYKALVT